MAPESTVTTSAIPNMESALGSTLSLASTLAGDSSLHPEFASPNDAPIFVATDGTGFRFQWRFLVPVSPYFDNLSRQAQPDEEDTKKDRSWQDTTIPLPFATGNALRFALQAIKNTFNGFPAPAICDPILTARQDLRIVLNEILILSDKYQLRLVKRSLACAAKQENLAALDQYVLRVAAGDRHFGKRMCLDLLKISTHDLYNWEQMTQHTCPGACAQLSVLHRRHVVALAELRKQCNTEMDRIECDCREGRHRYRGFNWNLPNSLNPYCSLARAFRQAVEAVSEDPVLLLSISDGLKVAGWRRPDDRFVSVLTKTIRKVMPDSIYVISW